MEELQLPPGVKPKRSSRSVAGLEDNENSDKKSQQQKSVVPASRSASGSSIKAFVCAKPDGRRCETCPHKDSDEDPVIIKLKALHGSHFAIILQSGPKFFTMLRTTEDGNMICWWGNPQKPTGETVCQMYGYCLSIYYARVKPRKITMKSWKTSLGMNPKQLECHQKAVQVMCDCIVEKGAPVYQANTIARNVTCMFSFSSTKASKCFT